MLRIDSTKIAFLQRKLPRWYRKNFRKLPWRETRDPYKILISEIMLQQTQVSRVEQKFGPFIKRFPGFVALARTSRAEVVRSWRGMGYNNRAVRLQVLARIVVEEHDGRLPADVAQLETLPGIGRYTARAIACFAYGRRVLVVDVNVRRVLSRIFWEMKTVLDRKADDAIWRLAEQILPGSAHEWNQALMELGATICTARKPGCENCPARTVCSSRMLCMKRSPHTTHHSRRKKREPMHAGIPQRFWRGRIVEALRGLDGKGFLSLAKLGKTINPGFDKRELSWLELVVNNLVRDGVVERTGEFPSTKITLAEG